MNDAVKYFIEKYAYLIEDGKWEEILEKLRKEIYQYLPKFNYAMIEAGIDPIEGLTYIPAYFLHNTDIDQYIISPDIREIRPYAFIGCNKLSKIIIPDNVTEIDAGAFSSCSHLTFIKLSNKLFTLSSYLLAESAISEIIIPDSVKVITNGVFANCKNLSEVHLGNSLEEIGYNAFEDCTALTAINIPDSVTKIDMGAFKDCTALTTINIPKNIKEISYQAFDGCKNLKTLIIPEHLLSSDFNTRDLPVDIGISELKVPENVTLDTFLQSINNQSDVKALKNLHVSYDIIIGGTKYTFNDICNKAQEKIDGLKKSQSKIPTLYRVQSSNKDYYLATATFDKKNNWMRVHFINKAGGTFSTCPLFFQSADDAEKFVDKMPDMMIPDIYEAKLSIQDQNFTEIETAYGPALIQSWKDSRVNPACIIKKDIF